MELNRSCSEKNIFLFVMGLKRMDHSRAVCNAIDG